MNLRTASPPFSARKHLEQAITLDAPRKGRSLYFDSEDPGVDCLALAALTLWALGYPDQALKRMRESLTLAQELSRPLKLAIALECAAELYQCRREVEATQQRVELLIPLSHEQGFMLWEAIGLTLRGWALAKRGHEQEGIAQIRQGLAATEAAGAKSWQPYFWGLLAEAYAETEQAEEGLMALTEALDVASRTGGRRYEAELYRLKGELLLLQTDCQAAQVESCFQRAIEVACEQSAKSWELRATTSLAHLLAQQGRRDEAQSMLAKIYGWFTEGFDTPDLKDAKSLLEELVT